MKPNRLLTLMLLFALGIPPVLAADLNVQGNITVEENATVGTGTAKGNLEVMGKTGSGTGLNLKVSGDGGVYFPSGTSTILPGVISGDGLLFIPAKSALRLGNFNIGALNQIGYGSIALAGGYAPSTCSIAVGNAVAYDPFSVAFGDYSEADGVAAMALGQSTYSSGDYSHSVNYGTSTYGDSSFAAGLFSRAMGDASAAFGENTTAQAYGSFVIGRYNKLEGDPLTWQDGTNGSTQNDPLFVIGNGSGYSNRGDAFVIYKDGKANLYGASATTPAIVLDPNTPQITINGQPVAASNSSGNFGFGTSSPSEKLDVVGNQKLSGYLKFPAAYGNADDGKIVSGAWGAGLNMVGTNTDNTYRKFRLWGEITQIQNDGRNTWAGTNYFSGNVGIGTSVPTAKLDVNGAVVSSTTTYPNYRYNSANRISFGESIPPASETGSVVAIGSGSSSRNMVVAISKTGVNSSFLGNDGSNFVLGQQSGGIVFRTGINHSASNTLATGTAALRVLPDGTVLVKTSGDISPGQFTNGPTP